MSALTGPVDLQTVLRTTCIVRFSRAPVGIVIHSSITPQPLSVLISEENEYKKCTTVVRRKPIKFSFEVKPSSLETLKFLPYSKAV